MSEHTPVVSITPYADMQMTFQLSDELRNFMEFRGVSLGDEQARSYVKRRVTDFDALVDLQDAQEKYKQLALSIGARAVVSQTGIQRIPGNPDSQRIYFASDRGSPLLTSLMNQFEQFSSQEILQKPDKSLLSEPLCYMDVSSQDGGLTEKVLGSRYVDGIAAVIGRNAKNGSKALSVQLTGLVLERNRDVQVGDADAVVQFPGKTG